MIGEWWSYRPQDFLLFSERVYWRLFELHNASVWPAQVLALAAGGAMLAALATKPPRADRWIAAALALGWVFVAWAFLWDRYATINWAARYAVPPFVLEALLLAGFGTVRGRLPLRPDRGVRSAVGLTLLVYALAVHPFVPLASGRAFAQAEVFAIAPDPTAIGTLGLLAMAPGGARTWLVRLVPLLWLGASGLTLRTMGTWEAAIPLAAALLALAAAVVPEGLVRRAA